MSAHARARRGAGLLAAGLGAGLLTAAIHVSLVPRALAISFWGEEKHAAEAGDPTPTASIAPAAPLAGVPVITLPDFAALAEALSPSVVNISTTSQGNGNSSPGVNPFGGGDPHEFFEPWERFFGPQPKQRGFKQRSLGSGFIINKDGYILTNNHVVENADEILVKLEDEREFKAKVIGRDPKTDIAVIRIESAADLIPAPLGNSDQLRVGEWVMSIGNPFALEHSVTAGIVSAKQRFIGQGSYDQFIQTDAAINPGNSGGPLINLRGEVVGINSAIFSRSGGNIGIGFAIPINLAKELIPQLEEKGRVTRGWLGVLIQKVTPEIAEHLELKDAKGALVADVVADGPAKEAGLKVGDVITEFDGHAVKDSTELPLLVARTGVGKSVQVKVIRDKKVETMTVTVAELKDDEAQVASGKEENFGLTVQAITPDIAESLGLSRDIKGVVVSGVESGTAADEAGLRRGDVILEVNRKPIEDIAAYRKALKAGAGKSLLLLVRRGENTIFVPLKPAE